MARTEKPANGKSMIGRKGLEALIAALKKRGYKVIGPQIAGGAIVYEPLNSAEDLPLGWSDEQDGGSYRLVKRRNGGYFDHVVGPQSWKKYLFPPVQKLMSARRGDDGVHFEAAGGKAPRYAFVGVRGCDVQAIAAQDRVFDNGEFADPGYLARRRNAFIVAVNCVRPGGTCFCVSMKTGPRVRGGFDVALTELPGADGFLAETGSARGARLMAGVSGRRARPADTEAADKALRRAAGRMKRKMPRGAEALLKRNLEHPRWEKVAERCLGCANCTMVCPTCFCSTTEDVTDLKGDNSERWRRWDSCFTVDFSYIHGGSIRKEASSRYRQWMTHKLAHWRDQFGMPGCVGCGRCITWCPVGIDITEETRAIQASEEK